MPRVGLALHLSLAQAKYSITRIRIEQPQLPRHGVVANAMHSDKDQQAPVQRSKVLVREPNRWNNYTKS